MSGSASARAAHARRVGVGMPVAPEPLDRRSSATMMLRSASVSGRSPIPASALGESHRKERVSWSSPTATHRNTAPPRLWPAFRIPIRSSPWSARSQRSHSSRSKVGRRASTVRNSAAADALAADSGRAIVVNSKSRSVVFPHCFTGLVIVSIGRITVCSLAHVQSVHAPIVVAAPGGSQTNRAARRASRSRISPVATGSGQGSGACGFDGFGGASACWCCSLTCATISGGSDAPQVRQKPKPFEAASMCGCEQARAGSAEPLTCPFRGV